jgi:hypothetical protein
MLLSSLENKNYVLFFDNYHVVENKDIHDIFSRFKDMLRGSTIVITTRNPPPFVSQIDRVKKKITEESIEGFDLDSTKEYLEQMGVDISSEQLIELDKRMGGHPLSLLMFASLEDEMDVNMILDNLPKTGIEKYLYDEIYKRLNDNEQRVLEAISIFRTPVTLKACVSVSKGENIKKTLISLEEKLLAKRKEKLYYLHDLIRDFSYNLIDDPKEYHRLAGKYYAQLEKTPENILETTYHMIKDTGVVNDEVVKYLIGASKDSFTAFIVLETLKENEITSQEIFELLNDFGSTPDLIIRKMFIIGYGDFFEKIWKINHEKSIGVLKQILNSADSNLLDMLSKTIGKMAYAFPDEACELWKNIIDKGDRDVHTFVSFHILDSNIDSKKAASILKYLVNVSDEATDLRYAKKALENWGLLETKIMTCEDHLETLRERSIDEKLLYIKQIKDVTDSDFIIEILNNVYSQDPDQVVDVLKLLIKSRFYKYNSTMHRITKLISKLARINIKYLKMFLGESEDNEYIKFVGLRALDRIKYELGEENASALLAPMLLDKNLVIQKLASIMEVEMKSSLSPTASSIEKKSSITSKLKMLNPKYLIGVLETDLSRTTPLTLLMNSWGLQKAIEGTDPELILEILKPLGKYDDVELRNIFENFLNTIQAHPSRILSIANLGLKLRVEHKIGAIWVICNVGNLAPQKAIKYLEPLTESKDPIVCFNLTYNLMDLRDTIPDETKKLFEKLSVHPDRDVRGLGKLMLNGI